MIRALEFHDSRLMTISEAIGRTEIVLRGYVHQWERHRDVWKGTGWIQQVRIRVLDSIPQTAEPEGPVGLSDGAIDTSDGRLNNGVELPFEASGPCTISIQTTQGDIITVTGREVFVIAEGEPTFVEALPEDMRSKEAVEADPRGKSSSWRCARAGRSTARR